MEGQLAMLLLMPGGVSVWTKKMQFDKFPKRNGSTCGGFLLAMLLEMLESIHYFRQLTKVGLWEETSQ